LANRLSERMHLRPRLDGAERLDQGPMAVEWSLPHYRHAPYQVRCRRRSSGLRTVECRQSRNHDGRLRREVAGRPATRRTQPDPETEWRLAVGRRGRPDAGDAASKNAIEAREE
jgi:hypothetical protein